VKTPSWWRFPIARWAALVANVFFYRTREGDTLDEIADVFTVSVDDLIEWNNLDPEARLQPKLVVQVFVRDGFDRANVALLDPSKVRVATLGSQEFLDLEAARRGKTRLQYTARAGDTLAKIAKPLRAGSGRPGPHQPALGHQRAGRRAKDRRVLSDIGNAT